MREFLICAKIFSEEDNVSLHEISLIFLLKEEKWEI